MKAWFLKRRDGIEDVLMKIKFRRERLGKKKIKPQKKPATQLPPIPIEHYYNRILQRHISNIALIVKSSVIPHIPELVQERNQFLPEAARVDGWPENAANLVNAMALSIDTLQFNKGFVATDVGQKSNEWHDLQWRKVMRSVIGVEIYQQEPWLNDTLNSFTAENVQLITKMEQDLKDNIGGTVQRGLRNGESSRTIAKNIQKNFKTTRNRAKLISRDQVSKLNSQLTELRQTNLGIEMYWWRTSGDERVRSTHKANSGKKFSWSKEPATTGHPGHDVQCRCTAEADFTPVLEALG